MEKEILEKLEESKFAEKILDCLDVDEVEACFDEAGIQISEEDAEKILCSVYGVKLEPEFASDYDMALCAGGKHEKSPDDNARPLNPLASAENSEEEILKNILRKLRKNKK